jgi:hypothetical protein
MYHERCQHCERRPQASKSDPLEPAGFECVCGILLQVNDERNAVGCLSCSRSPQDTAVSSLALCFSVSSELDILCNFDRQAFGCRPLNRLGSRTCNGLGIVVGSRASISTRCVTALEIRCRPTAASSPPTTSPGKLCCWRAMRSR